MTLQSNNTEIMGKDLNIKITISNLPAITTALENRASEATPGCNTIALCCKSNIVPFFFKGKKQKDMWIQYLINKTLHLVE